MGDQSPGEKETLGKEIAEKAFLASVSKLLSKISFQTDWGAIVGIFGFSTEASETHRFYQSHHFGDEDYPGCLRQFLTEAYAVSPERALAMIKYVIDELKNEGKLLQSEIDRYPALKGLEANAPNYSLTIPKTEMIAFLAIQEFPDDFYRELLGMINHAFSSELYVAVCLMTRKMLENLLVDILRKKFGMANLDLFYDPKYHGFKEFKTLIINFESKLDGFQQITPSLDSEFIKLLHSFREQGNGAAHTLEVRVTKKELLDNKTALEFVIKTLVRLFNNC